MSAEAEQKPLPPTVNDDDFDPQDPEQALRIVLRKSIEVNGLVRGLSEVARTLDRRTAHLCILASDCEDASYRRLIEALCAQNNIDIIQVSERSKLAEWAGLVKRDREGAIKKTFKCSCVAIKDFGERTRALDTLLAKLSS